MLGRKLAAGAVRRVRATTVLAIVAIVLAGTGGAAAATRYLITSTRQIKPSVLRDLKAPGAEGSAGKEGAAGKEGPPGKEGAPGKEGPAGKEGASGKEGPGGKEGAPGKEGKTGFTSVLPTGATETGTWQVDAEGIVGEHEVRTTISFPIPVDLATGSFGKAVFLKAGETEKEGCTGTVFRPTAPSGKLCIYAEAEEIAHAFTTPFVGFDEEEGFGPPGTYIVYGTSGGTVEAPSHVKVQGSWAVTAP